MKQQAKCACSKASQKTYPDIGRKKWPGQTSVPEAIQQSFHMLSDINFSGLVFPSLPFEEDAVGICFPLNSTCRDCCLTTIFPFLKFLVFFACSSPLKRICLHFNEKKKKSVNSFLSRFQMFSLLIFLSLTVLNQLNW